MRESAGKRNSVSRTEHKELHCRSKLTKPALRRCEVGITWEPVALPQPRKEPKPEQNARAAASSPLSQGKIIKTLKHNVQHSNKKPHSVST